MLQVCADFSALPLGIAAAALARATRVHCLYCRARHFLPPLETFLDAVSPSFSTAASADTPAIVTLNSKNHIAHHLSVTGQHRGFGHRLC
jgi:hypothetical protein